jgi:hypothetical protein
MTAVVSTVRDSCALFAFEYVRQGIFLMFWIALAMRKATERLSQPRTPPSSRNPSQVPA